ncbi:S-adenosyl-L-methionine-dependent methyltransferase [Elsinoe ampelina]|uniref:S-adenosyl-L-methionine-dependent methyltransferase n=1 Tax=Elsinoe ampelina TaxID=302913 RepID=A0A6A6GA70_9PEZI|nr:S-adenosyl-L-methionine-dependent methyltransferase [Elsinoe ampelina]
MSLYFEAAKILEDINEKHISLKERVFKDKELKSSPATVFALVSEAGKWSEILSEVIDRSQVLSLERKLTPALSVVLVHDILLAKNGLALSKKHVLYDTITKHRARLTAELTRSRIKRSLPSLDALRSQINATATSVDIEAGGFHPRWVRVNTLVTSVDAVTSEHFSTHQTVSTLAALSSTPNGIYVDPHIPSLLALHPSVDLTRTKAYRSGHIILQDKASCFPAFLLDPSDGRVIDGCAAPGNKTTHLASILHEKDLASGNDSKRVIACERSPPRAETLKTMVRKAGADKVIDVRAGQDFLMLKPDDWQDVSAILLDPSCSGSGIVGRDDGTRRKIIFPVDPKKTSTAESKDVGKGKKRKRGKEDAAQPRGSATNGDAPVESQVVPEDEEVDAQYTQVVEGEKLKERLRALSSFQLKLLLHAFRFSGAKRITYSTCSIHVEENEGVVVKALISDVARERGWRVMTRAEQVDGMQR